MPRLPTTPPLDELPHAVQREGDVEVAIDAGVIETDAGVALHDVRGLGIGRNDTIRRVAALDVGHKRLVVPQSANPPR